jgi:hypothetical protein
LRRCATIERSEVGATSYTDLAVPRKRQLKPALSARALYAVEPEGGGVAGCVHWDPQRRLVTWLMPGGRQRAYTVARKLPARAGEVFAFVDERGRRFTLRPLTAKLYNASVRLLGQPAYANQRELRAAYEQSLAG